MDNAEAIAYEASLTAPEKQSRERFVHEYLFDRDARAAAKRLGYHGEYSKKIAYGFVECPYVQRLLVECDRQFADDPKAEAEETKRVIRAALLREATYRGPGSSHAARVSALAKLATMHDMDAALKIKSEVKNMGGVMQVPEIADIEAWQKAALASQSALQEGVE